MKTDFKKNVLPHFIVVFICLTLAISYFAPEIFDDKGLVQGDVINTQGWGKDLRDYHYETGEYAFWSNSMFSGMPANYTYMPPSDNIFRSISDVLHKIMNYNVLLLFLYFIGFYIFMLSIGCRPWLSLIGAIAYTFASYNIIIIVAGHVNKALVMSTIAPILGGIILCYKKKHVWGAIVTMLFTGLNVFWAHQQITYYLLIMIIVLATVYLVYAIKEHTLKDYFKSSAILIVVGALAILPEYGTLSSTYDYSKETMRGGAVLQSNPDGQKESSGLEIDYAFDWSYEKAETFTLLIPNFYGASTRYNIGENSNSYDTYRKLSGNPSQAKQFATEAPMYWGNKPATSGPVYVGAIICFLFVLGLFLVKIPEKWWLLIVTIISFILSWGKNFIVINEFIFHYLPFYNKFRIPEMALVISQVSMVALAVLALKEIFDNKDNKRIFIKPLYISAGITGGLCLLFALFGGYLMSFSGSQDSNFSNFTDLFTAIVSDRKAMLSSDAWRSFLLIGIAALVLWWYLNKSTKPLYVLSIIGIMILGDLWVVDKRFLNHDDFVPIKKATEILPTEADLLILRDKDPNYRVFDYTSFMSARTSFFHKSLGGYSPAKLRRYQDIIDYYFAGNLNPNVINMLNAKYFIVPSQQGQPQVQQNPEALGNVWFVNEIKWVDTPDEEIIALKDFNPTQTAYIHKEWQSSLNGWEALQHEKDSTAYIRMTDYANPGNIFYESSSTMPHLAVFSEVHYKTWRAYIDGKEVPVIRVNYILRGLEVPAGNHKIEFKCIDDIYLRGAKISMVSSTIVGIVILCLLGFAILTAFKRCREKVPVSPLISKGKKS